MPEFNLSLLAVLVILLPGFLAARLEQRLTVGPKQNEFDKVVEALLYSLLIYLASTVVARSLPVSIKVEKIGEATRYSVETSLLRLAILPLIALLFAAAMSWASNNDILGRFFRRIGVTRRTWRASIWSDVFHGYVGVVQVELADGRSVLGWLKYYSDRPENCSLFLERAAWVSGEGLVQIHGPGILLTKDCGIRSIAFLNWKEAESPLYDYSNEVG